MVSSEEKVIICSANKPSAKLVAYKTDSKPRKLGAFKDKIKIAKDFNALPKDFLKFFD